jgi:hypothetical protein
MYVEVSEDAQQGGAYVVPAADTQIGELAQAERVLRFHDA